MSRVLTTPLGRFAAISRDGRPDWLFECPGCGTWAHLDDDQMHGRVSVDHAADGCPGRYHETHDYATAIAGEGGSAAAVPMDVQFWRAGQTGGTGE